MYQSELCRAKKRGRLVSAELFMVFFGIVIAYWYNYGMTFVSNSSSWRLPIASQILFALVRQLFLNSNAGAKIWLTTFYSLPL